MPEEDTRRGRGRPRSPHVEEKVRAATRDLVAAEGYDGTSVDAVAHRAGVTKAAIYRRWANKATLIYDAVLVGGEENLVPDTGDVRDDLLVVIRTNARALRDPAANSLITRLIAEAANDPELAHTLRADYFAPRAARISDRIRVAVQRGELLDSVDADLLPALLTGPLQYILSVYGRDLSEHKLERIVDSVLAAHLPGR
jgi:AcrR family transcriptional regulator